MTKIYTSAEGVDVRAERVVHPDGTDVIEVQATNGPRWTLPQEDVGILAEAFNRVRTDPTPVALAGMISALVEDIAEHVVMPYDNVMTLARGLLSSGWSRDSL